MLTDALSVGFTVTTMVLLDARLLLQLPEAKDAMVTEVFPDPRAGNWNVPLPGFPAVKSTVVVWLFAVVAPDRL